MAKTPKAKKEVTRVMQLGMINSKVAGRYYGQRFTGVIESSRCTYGWDEVATIKLDKSIEVLGGVKNMVLISASELVSKQHKLVAVNY